MAFDKWKNHGIPKLNKGGGIPDLTDPTNRDTIPAMLTEGEFVVNKDAMEIPHLAQQVKKINDMGLQKRMMDNKNMGGPLMGYNVGGMIRGYNTGGLVAAAGIDEDELRQAAVDQLKKNRGFLGRWIEPSEPEVVRQMEIIRSKRLSDFAKTPEGRQIVKQEFLDKLTADIDPAQIEKLRQQYQENPEGFHVGGALASSKSALGGLSEALDVFRHGATADAAEGLAELPGIIGEFLGFDVGYDLNFTSDEMEDVLAAYVERDANILQQVGMPETEAWENALTLQNNTRLFSSFLDPTVLLGIGIPGKTALAAARAAKGANNIDEALALVRTNLGDEVADGLTVNPTTGKIDSVVNAHKSYICLLYTSPSPRDS